MRANANPNCIFDQNGVIQRANTQFDEILEVSHGKTLSSNLFDSIPGNQIDAFRESLESVRNNQSSESFVLQLITDKGSELNLDVKLHSGEDLFFLEVTYRKEKSISKFIVNEKKKSKDSPNSGGMFYF